MSPSRAAAPRPAVTATKRTVLLLTPPLLLASTYLMYAQLAEIMDLRVAYLTGFLFYWCGWCLALPLWILGPAGVRQLFQNPTRPLGRRSWVGLLLLVAPPAAGYATIAPVVFPGAGPLVVSVSALIAVINGTLEELLWRGAFPVAFPTNQWLGCLYPSLGFGIWHLAPQVIFPNQMPGGRISLVASAIVLGLMWGWVAWRTRSIRWTTLSHVLMDFSGLGGRVYLG